MKLTNLNIPPILLIDRNSINNIKDIIDNNNFTIPLIVSGKNSWNICGNTIYKDLNYPMYYIISDNTMSEIKNIMNLIEANNVDLICAIGGGKVIDVCKYAAFLEKIDILSIPTSPSHDGICSPVSVIKFENNTSQSLKARMPIGIICDINILENAPENTIKSGIGDLVSNIFAVQDWKLAYEKGHEKEYNGFAALLSENPAKNMIDILSRHDLHDKILIQNLIEGLVLSGIAMEIAGSSRPCSGAEHLFSHALDSLFGGIASHGEQVAVGSILIAYIRNQDYRYFIQLFKKTGIPTDYKSLGATREQIIDALVYGPQTRPGRHTILSDIGLNKNLAEEIAQNAGVI